jgi:hypothetical protein
MRGIATARSASAHTIAADLPPSSSETRFIVAAQAAMIRLPASVEPVKATLSTPGWATRWAPASRSPGTTLTTPAGTPAAASASAKTKFDSGASGAGLSTTVHPAASAGAVFQAASVTGAFHGTMAATTPTGDWVTTPARSSVVTVRSNS